MTTIYGYPQDSTSIKYNTNEIESLDQTVKIELDDNEINLIGTNVLVNGSPISGGGGGVTNPLTSDLNIGSFDITGVGFGGLQTLNGLNTTVSIHGSDINALKANTFNISNVINDTSTEIIGDLLSSSLSNGSIGSLIKPFENLFLTGNSISGALSTTSGNIIHSLNGIKTFTIGDDGNPFSLLYFSVGATQILSQIKHVFSNGLEPFTTGIGSLGSTLKRFNTLWVDSVNGLTPVGGLYAGTSLGTVINGGILGSLLPNSGVGSLSVPANGFKVGDSFHLVCSGSIPVGDKDDVFTITLNQNGTQLGQIAVDMEDMTDASFELEADFQVHSIGVSGQFVTSFDFTFNRTLLKNFSGTRLVQVSFVDTTLPSNLTLTGQFSGQLNSTIITALFYLRKQY